MTLKDWCAIHLKEKSSGINDAYGVLVCDFQHGYNHPSKICTIGQKKL